MLILKLAVFYTEADLKTISSNEELHLFCLLSSGGSHITVWLSFYQRYVQVLTAQTTPQSLLQSLAPEWQCKFRACSGGVLVCQHQKLIKYIPAINLGSSTGNNLGTFCFLYSSARNMDGSQAKWQHIPCQDQPLHQFWRDFLNWELLIKSVVVNLPPLPSA